MKGKILTGTLFGLGLMVASQAQAISTFEDFAEGSISYPSGIDATGVWADSATTLTFDVDFDPYTGNWKYTYTLDVSGNLTEKDVSHLNIEVTAGDDPFTDANIMSATDYYTLGTQGSSNGNPNIPGDMYGIKWDAQTDTSTFMVMIVSDRGPMWGDFYAKDGKTDGDYNTAWNTGFGDDVPICFAPNLGGVDGSCWSNDHILVPDSFSGPPNEIPVPAAVWLFGSGLLGLVGVARRKRV